MATFEKTLQQMIDQERRKLLQIARKLVPDLTPEDILNPHDYPKLMASSQFNYEDGYLAGLLAVQMAHEAYKKQKPTSS